MRTRKAQDGQRKRLNLGALYSWCVQRCSVPLLLLNFHDTGFDTYVRNLNVYLQNVRAEEEVRPPVLLLHLSLTQCVRKLRQRKRPRRSSLVWVRND